MSRLWKQLNTLYLTPSQSNARTPNSGGAPPDRSLVEEIDEDNGFIVTGPVDDPGDRSKDKSLEIPVSITASLYPIRSSHKNERQLSWIEEDIPAGDGDSICSSIHDVVEPSPIDGYLLYNSHDIDELKQKVENLSRDLIRANTTIEEYQYQQSQDQELLNREKGACTRLKKLLGEVGSALASSESARLKLQEGAEREKEVLILEVNRTEEELLNTKVTVDDLRRQLEEERGRLAESKQSLDSVQTELGSAQEAYLNLQAKSSKEINKLTHEIEDLRQAARQLRSSISIAASSFQSAENRHGQERAALMKEKETLKESMRSSEDAHARLIENLSNEKETLRLELGETTQSLSKANATIEETKLRHEQVLELLTSEKVKSAALEVALDEAQSALTLAELEHPEHQTPLSQQIDTLVRERNELRHTVGDLKQELSNATSVHEDYELRIGNLRNMAFRNLLED